MSLTKLEIVVLLHQHKKVTDVAKQLGVKQPTVSFHMKSLEEEYGVALFENRMGKILFTEAGEALYHYAVKISALAKEARRIIGEFETMERGTLRIGASYVPGIYLLAGLLSDFSKHFPQISIHLEVKTAPVIQQLLLQHELDIGLISTQAVDSTELISEQIRRDELVIVLPMNHPLAVKQKVTAEDLAHEPFILHDVHSTTRQMLEAWAEQHHLKLQPKLEVNSIEIIKQSVANGHGITCLSMLAVEKEVAAGKLAYLHLPKLQATRFIYCCYHRERLLTKPIQLFLEEIRSVKEQLVEV